MVCTMNIIGLICIRIFHEALTLFVSWIKKGSKKFSLQRKVKLNRNSLTKQCFHTCRSQGKSL